MTVKTKRRFGNICISENANFAVQCQNILNYREKQSFESESETIFPLQSVNPINSKIFLFQPQGPQNAFLENAKCHATNHTSNHLRMPNICVNDMTDEVIIFSSKRCEDVPRSKFSGHSFNIAKTKSSGLLAKGVVEFVFELLFYICPKSSSSKRNYFLPAFVGICCTK